MDIGITIVIFGGYGFLIGIPLLFVFWLVTGRYYDNQLGFKKVYNPFAQGNVLPGFLMRSGQYATMIFFRRGAKKSYDRLVFGDTDFRELARPIDKFLSFSFVIIGMGGPGIAGIGGIIHFGFYLVSLL